MEDLRRNGSGYIDPTAYKAIRNIEGVKEMERGEIYEVEYSGDYKEAVVIAVHPKLCTVLMLDDREHDDSVEVISTSIKYTNPEKLSYKMHGAFGRFVKKMKDDDFERLMRQVIERLKFCDFCDATTPDSYDYASECARLELKLKEAQAEIRQLREETFESDDCTKLSESVAKAVVELTKVTAERDLYKEQYEKLLERLIGK